MAMNVSYRLQETEQKFNTKQSERDEYLKLADGCLEEMHKLQGEFRVLTDLGNEPEIAKPDLDMSSTIEVVPEEVEQ